MTRLTPRISCIFLVGILSALLSGSGFETTFAQQPDDPCPCSASAYRSEEGYSLYRQAGEDWKAKRWESAVEKYHQIIQNYPFSPLAARSHMGIGLYLKYMRRYDEAILDFEKGISMMPQSREAQDAKTSIACIHTLQGQYQDALNLLREVLAETKDWDQVKYCTYWIKKLKRFMAYKKNYGQKTSPPCGPAALATAFRLKGIKASLEEVEKIIPHNGEKVTLQDLKEAAKAKGLKAIGMRLTLDQLKAIKKPVIVLLRPNHYVVVTDFNKKGIKLIEPTKGDRQSVISPKDIFQKFWTGYALVFEKKVTPQAGSRLLSKKEMEEIWGGVCYCCPEGNNGGPEDNQNTNFEQDNSSINGGQGPGDISLLVNTVNLNFIVQDVDLSYSGLGPRVEIRRTYNADDPTDGPFGRSWTFNYNVSLTEDPWGDVTIRRGSGAEHTFKLNWEGGYDPPRGVHDTLVKNDDGTFSLKIKRDKTTQNFDSSGKLTSIVDRNGNALTFSYDTDGNLISITDAAGRVTTFTYNSNNKIVRVTDPIGRTATYNYDANGNLISTTDMAGNTFSYTYDENSYMTAITGPKGTTNITYTTSSDGYALKSLTDPLGNTKNYGTYGGYDNVKITDAKGNSTLYENMEPGWTKKIIDPLGNSIEYGYDDEGNRTSIKDANGGTTSFTYDDRGNITSVTDPLGNTTTYTYDSKDNLIRVSDPLGRSYAYTYDGNGNLIRITDPKGNRTTFSYDSHGQLVRLTDAKGSTTTFSYDTHGNLISMRDPLGNTTRYTYDGVGRMVGLTDANGNTTSYTYDGIDRITRISYPDGTNIQYTYDCCGLLSVTDRNGNTTSFEYDKINRLTKATDGYGNTIQYGYDKAGNRTSITYPNGNVVTYEYDKSYRLIKVTDWLNNTTTYTYDSAGNLTSTTYPNGTTVTYTYDKANRLTSLVNAKSDESTICAYYYGLDGLGNRTGVLKEEPLSPTLVSKNITYSYDSDNRLLSANGASFSYDANGNLIYKHNGTTATYDYDYDNRLINLTSNGSTTQYQYDGLGNRIAKIINGSTTRYVVDTNRILPQVLTETDGSGNITAYYIYGLGLVSKITPSGEAYYYHYDGLGSTIAMTDSNGNIVNKYAYDEFGNLLGSEETTSNPFRYLGRYGVMDEGNGLMYMRARYYDAEIGRFLKKDSIGLFGGLNMYIYCYSNPVNFVDPFGWYTSKLRKAAKLAFEQSIGPTLIWGAIGAGAGLAISLYTGQWYLAPVLSASGFVIGTTAGAVYGFWKGGRMMEREIKKGRPDWIDLHREELEKMGW